MSLTGLAGTKLKSASALGVVLIGGALMLGACSSSNNNNTTTTTTTAASTGATTTSTASSGASGATTTSTATSGASGATSTSTSGSSGTSSTTGSTGSASGGTGGLKAIANKLQTGEDGTFDAQYKVTGGTAATVEVAENGGAGFAFIVGDKSGEKEDIFGTSNTADACTQQAGSSAWTCIDLGSSGLGSFGELTQFYSGKYWAQTLAPLEAEAATQGATTSTQTIAGQTAECVTYQPNTAAGGTICVTDSGALAEVKSQSNDFELTSFSTSVSPSLFQPPAGATVTSEPGIP